MAEFDYDLFIIGAGSGGVRASRIASTHGAKVAIAEEYRVGGTCVIRGCVPKKLYVYASQFAQSLKTAAHFGADIQGVKFDWPQLRDNILAEVTRLEGLYNENLANNKVQLFTERATLSGPNTVRLASGEEVTAEKILIATGGWPFVDDFPGKEFTITSNDVFHLEALPKRVLIAGGGYIANEFAGVFNGLGSEATIATRGDRILRGYDTQITDHLLAISQDKGIDFRFNSLIQAIEKNEDDSLRVLLNDGDVLEVDAVLMATGRVPNSVGLGCEDVGVALDEDGAVIVNERGQTSISSIYAVGDVTNRVQLTPVAIREGHAFADNMFGEKNISVQYDYIPSAVFCDPPIGTVGLTEEQARELFSNVKVFTSNFRAMKNAFTGSSHRDLYKMVVDGDTDRVIGVHLIGADTPEIIQVAGIAVKAGLTKAAFDATIALHPTGAEELVLMR